MEAITRIISIFFTLVACLIATALITYVLPNAGGYIVCIVGILFCAWLAFDTVHQFREGLRGHRKGK